MSEASSVAPAAELGFFQRLTGLYTSPTETFRSIVARPTALVPILILLVLAGGFSVIWMSKVDRQAFMREQLEQSPRTANMPPEQKAQIVEKQAQFMPVFTVVILVFLPLFYLGTALVYMVIFRFLFGADLTYKQSLAITAWSFLAVGLISTPLMLAVFALKGDWNIDPGKILQANLTLVLPATAPKWLTALASSIDLFSIWIITLLSAGYGVASRRTLSGALTGVLIPWIVIIICKVGWAALMG
ncbi:MAG TPA: YIP1 family protein [Vicinamibacteria bacterium]